ncbi:GIY-YIG nuclease family protein [Clostridium sporogenes]|uniref:GIY-YIG domain-containing protein n=2 Tax=Clostridium TaxID=1485 RepID=A0A6M0T064_CLOBO|nr:GIY-YIG nuclease family protein [Clostridium sporogenes]NFA60854.1 hypothetical protein [Clostridium botulinum]NFI72473.1 hypothetical protein [Clostridium sporogenes]NFL73348.1 hypothetical protein [Clostridium sporogenes]NFM23629.1 hypothetical protein [Clostridium sporogenes]NFP60679.1 hypothetical protein [Clostridium sporogenes]
MINLSGIPAILYAPFEKYGNENIRIKKSVYTNNNNKSYIRDRSIKMLAKRMSKLGKIKSKINVDESIDIENDGGIYMLYSINGERMYIGETANFIKRYKSHISALRNKRHHNELLQFIYNKYGEEDLLYIPICKCPDFMRIYIERAYINKFELEAMNDNRYTCRTIDVDNSGYLILNTIDIKYRIIIESHRKWKYSEYNFTYEDYFKKMINEGMKIKKSGFKWIDEFESIKNLNMILDHIKEYYDFQQLTLDYVAIAIFNDILGKESDRNVFYKYRIKNEKDFESDDLIYNIYKEIRKNDKFRSDIINASIILGMDYNPHKQKKCQLDYIESIIYDLKAENVFDLLYIYIIYLIITATMEMRLNS